MRSYASLESVDDSDRQRDAAITRRRDAYATKTSGPLSVHPRFVIDLRMQIVS